MPLFFRDDGKPVVEFDPRLELSPFTLFRRLRDGRAPSLVDARRRPVGRTLRGAIPLPAADWRPPADLEVVLFDDDGKEALALADELHRAGCEGVRALFGGLQLYEFALDPEVVGAETYLVALADSGERDDPESD